MMPTTTVPASTHRVRGSVSRLLVLDGMPKTKRTIRYAMVDAFAGEPFKGNSAAVCLLEEDEAGGKPWDEQWMQSVASEFNTPITAFLVRSGPSGDGAGAEGDDTILGNPHFHIRWFTPVRESDFCGHGTLASAHYLITSSLVQCDAIEFLAKFGRLTAKKVIGQEQESTLSSSAQSTSTNFLIELDFPVFPVVKCNSSEKSSFSQTLNGASVINELQTVSAATDLILELNSCEEVINVRPNTAELVQCAGRGVAVTGPAHEGSSYDFVTRFFSPKYGLNEDPVCASVHCALAPYWGKKLGKRTMKAFMAYARSGTLYLQWDEESQRVRIRGEAVTVMLGTLLV